MKRTASIFAAVLFLGSLLTACGPDDITCSANQHKVDNGHNVTTYSTRNVGTQKKPIIITVPSSYWQSHWMCENNG